MTNSERVIAYLENSLDEVERNRFEEDLKTERDLQQEMKFQQQIIEGIRSARHAELKAMLNNVVVSGGQSSSGLGSQAWRAIGITTATIIVGAGAYLLWPEGENNQAAQDYKSPETEVNTMITEDTQLNIGESGEGDQAQETEVPDTESNQQKSANDGISEVPKINPPKGVDSIENVESSEIDLPEQDIFEVATNDPILVSVVNDNKRFDFHYEFENTELVLYGSFSETYEILDLMKNGERSIFLHYSGRYYFLDSQQRKISPLVEIKDQTLIGKLDSMLRN